MKIEQNYSEVLGLVWFSLFYVIAFPLGLFITLGGIIFSYLVDKVRN